MRLFKPTLIASLLLAGSALPCAAQPGGAASWQALQSRSPCDWLPKDSVQAIVGSEAQAKERKTGVDIGCSWRTARGQPLLSVTLVNWPSAANMVGERDELLRQVAQYGGDNFVRLPAPGGAASIVMRKDRGRVTIFPTNNAERHAINVSAHLVMKESPAEKDARRQRAIAYVEALVRQQRF
jgi:hypothetical protein